MLLYDEKGKKKERAEGSTYDDHDDHDDTLLFVTNITWSIGQ